MKRFVAHIRSGRGFVILVVMLLLAVATAVAMSQFSVVASESVASVRVGEEVQARANAEGCLTLLTEYAEGYIGTSPPGFKFADFDGLLDSKAGSNDDFLPAVGVRVLLPENVTGSDETKAMHQWAFVTRGAAPNQGGCLLRIEDNSDDGFPASSVPAGTTGADEGLGRDNPKADRDRSIYITAIGLYPVLPSTTAEKAYARAHARVTLRRLYATSNPVQTPPALQACDDVTLSANIDVCGLGGVQGDSITMNGGSTCGCGNYSGNTVTPTTPPAACTGCPSGTCSPPSRSVLSPSVPDPKDRGCSPPAIPNATYYMDNKGFGNPAKNDNNIGDKDSCKVHIDRRGLVFVWDTTDFDANDRSASNPIAAALAAGGVPAGPVINCQNYTGISDGAGGRIVELPCRWTTTGSEKIECNTDPTTDPRTRQTPCWKPIANLQDGGNEKTVDAVNMMSSDVWIDKTPTNPANSLSSLNGGNHFEMSSHENDEDLMFIKQKPIPNIRDQSKMFATGDPDTTMCGNAGGCEKCDGSSIDNWWTECSTRSKNPVSPRATCGDFHSHSHQNSAHIPWPIVFAWDVDPAAKIEFEYDSGATKPLNATILSSGNIKFGGDVSFCCAECGSKSGGNCTQPLTLPGITATGRTISAASCVKGGAEVPLPRFAVAPPAPGPVQFIGSGYGYAFKTDGVCEISANSTVVGDVECKAVEIPNNPCIIGQVLVTGGDDLEDCTGGSCTDANAPLVGVCLSGNAKIVGSIYSQGSVCAINNASLVGDIFTMGNVSFSANFTLEGQIFANQDITLGSNTTINFIGGNQILSAGSQGMASFMETNW
jgi:hypothetical protein